MNRFHVIFLVLLTAGALACGRKQIVNPGDTIPPSAVRDLAGSALSPTMVRLTWSAPFDEDSTRAVHVYDVRFSGVPITSGNFEISAADEHPPDPASPGTTQETTIGGLTGGRSFYFSIRSRDAAGNASSLSNVLLISTPLGPDETPPAAVTDLAVSSVASTKVTLTWTATGDDSVFGTASAYDLRYLDRDMDASNWDQATPIDGEPDPSRGGTLDSYTATGLPPGTRLHFGLRVLDESGNISGVSNSTNTTTTLITTWRIRSNGTGDAPTIQAGMDSAKTEDIVLVEPGRYFENIDFKGKAITVRSEKGPEVTIIDGSRKAAPVVSFLSGEMRSSIIHGLTITNGRGDVALGGGGVLASESEPTISSNIIEANSAIGHQAEPRSRWGGGILCRSIGAVRRPLIIENHIINNVAGGNGGGIGINYNVIAEIVSNSIDNNECLSGDGGGVWILVVVDENIVRNNRITRNTADDHGGGIHFGASGQIFISVDISYNIIWNNRANHSSGEVSVDTGGGMRISRANAIIASNTIAQNRGLGGEDNYGGGISIRLDGSTIIERNIVAFSTEGGGLLCHSGATPNIRNNIFWTNAGGDILGDCSGEIEKNGNIVADPMFCDLDTGDLCVDTDSPALHHPEGLIGAIGPEGCCSVPLSGSPMAKGGSRQTEK